MERKFYTFLIFPGAHGKMHKVRLPFYVVHLVLTFSVVGIITVAALSSSYAQDAAEGCELQQSADGTRGPQDAVSQPWKASVSQTNAKLGSLQSLASEVALTYGFGEPRRPRLSQAVMALATQSNSTLDSSYQRFACTPSRLMKAAAQNAPLDSTMQSLIANPNLGSPNVPSGWPLTTQIHGGVRRANGPPQR